jgi:hypothetical protein
MVYTNDEHAAQVVANGVSHMRAHGIPHLVSSASSCLTVRIGVANSSENGGALPRSPAKTGGLAAVPRLGSASEPRDRRKPCEETASALKRYRVRTAVPFKNNDALPA